MPALGLQRPLCLGCLLASALDEDDDSEAAAPDDSSFGVPYQVVTLMARNSDKVTYLAKPIGASTHVALEIIGPREDVQAILDRVRTWKSALTQVRHSHIARWLDAGPAGEGCIYLAGEYVGGPSLAVPACRERLTVDDRRAVLAQLVAAVELLHARGLAHLKLDASHVKIAEREGVHATAIGLGIGLIVDGMRPEPARDLEALAALARELGVAP